MLFRDTDSLEAVLSMTTKYLHFIKLCGGEPHKLDNLGSFMMRTDMPVCSVYESTQKYEPVLSLSSFATLRTVFVAHDSQHSR